MTLITQNECTRLYLPGGQINDTIQTKDTPSLGNKGLGL